MSTLKVTNIQDTSGGNSLTTAQIYSGTAKAWVNFNGTGTVSTNQSINASYNVSGVFKNATGIYTINFTNAMIDGNYSIGGFARQPDAGAAYAMSGIMAQNTGSGEFSTTSCKIVVGNKANTLPVDSNLICAHFFR